MIVDIDFRSPKQTKNEVKDLKEIKKSLEKYLKKIVVLIK